MPIYDYKCEKCGHEQEHMMKMSDNKPNCPNCGSSDEYQKQLSKGSFELKGKGWYKDGY